MPPSDIGNSDDEPHLGASSLWNERKAFRALQRQRIAAWCDTRPEAATLDLEGAYRELSELDAEEKSRLLEKVPEWTMWYQEMDVSAAFNPRRGQLRARADQLSRSKLRARALGGLPLEVLRIIFDTFEDAAVTEVGQGPARRLVAWPPREAYGWRRHELARERQDSVRSLRLVCRLFYDLASPLLFQTLHLHISQSSLDLVENISRSPRIASGVRGVQISLAYYPGNRGESLESYREHCDDLLNDQMECLLKQEMDESDDEDAIQNLLWDQFGDVADAWGSYLDDETENVGQAGSDSEVGGMLQDGYLEFRHLHEEQRGLLQDGRFVRALASAVARMPSARSFRFVDEWEPEDGNMWACLFKAPLDHPDCISRIITRPLTFAQMEGTNARPIEMESARLLWELPISLHRVGVAMTELKIDCFPKCANVSSLYPREQDGAPTGSGAGASNPRWTTLAAACQKLRFFDFMGPSDPVVRNGPLDDADKAQLESVDYFLGSILSACGPSLISLRISFPWVFLVPYEGFDYRKTHYHAGTILERLSTMPHLQALLLCRLNLQQRELHNICAKLGDGEINRLYLLDVELRNGTWAGAVDVLRKKLAQWALDLTGRVLGPVVRLSELRGAEFEGMAGEALEETVRYLHGQRDDNPLKATHGTTV